MSVSARINPASNDWLAVRDLATTERNRLRLALESPTLGERETDQLRGQIVALKWLLALPEDQVREAQGADEEPPSY